MFLCKLNYLEALAVRLSGNLLSGFSTCSVLEFQYNLRLFPFIIYQNYCRKITFIYWQKIKKQNGFYRKKKEGKQLWYHYLLVEIISVYC